MVSRIETSTCHAGTSSCHTWVAIYTFWINPRHKQWLYHHTVQKSSYNLTSSKKHTIKKKNNNNGSASHNKLNTNNQPKIWKIDTAFQQSNPYHPRFMQNRLQLLCCKLPSSEPLLVTFPFTSDVGSSTISTAYHSHDQRGDKTQIDA